MNRLKILFLVHRVPYPPDRGDRIRSFHLLKFLASRYDVWLGCLTDEAIDERSNSELKKHCRELAVVRLGKYRRWLRGAWSLARGSSATEGLFASSRLRRSIEEWTREIKFDAIVAFCSSMSPYTEIPTLKGVPLVVDLVDVDSEKWFDYASVSSGWKRAMFRLEGQRLRRLEKRLGGRAAAIVVTSESEAEVYRNFANGVRVDSIGNGVDLDYFRIESSNAKSRGNGLAAEPTCVFVGALDYKANVEGLIWFCGHVWPAVRQQRDNAKLMLVGRNPTPSVYRLAEMPGVEIAADVPDVRPYLDQAAIAIAPLRLARGIQNKVLEAMAMETAVVATPQALDGIRLEPGNHAISADGTDEWIRSILHLWNDASGRERLGQSARRFVEAHHHWDVRLEPFAVHLDGTASSGRCAVTGP